MSLTPEGVRRWKFGTTRLGRGYDQHEVDAFLELVEEELVDRDIQTEHMRETRWFDSGPELATIAEARLQADRILSQARGEASTILRTARRQAQQVATDAQDRPAQPQQSVQERCDAAFRPPAPASSQDERPGQPRTAWLRRPAFMLTFGVVAIMLTISSVGYRLMVEPQTVAGAAAVTADSHASLLHGAGGHAGGPDAERAAAGSDPPAPAPAPAPVRPPDPGERQSRAHSIAPVNAVAFGPHGQGQGDDPHGARLAVDGLRRTAWHTRRYTAARFGSLYPGTGLLLDMGSTVTITAVRVTLGAATGASFQIRIGNRPTLADLRPAASSAGLGGIVRLTLSRPVRGRYLAVWFTRLPPGPAGTYQAAIHGIGVKALGLMRPAAGG